MKKLTLQRQTLRRMDPAAHPVNGGLSFVFTYSTTNVTYTTSVVVTTALLCHSGGGGTENCPDIPPSA